MTMFDIWAYETSTGRSPVLDYIESVPKFDQAKIARTIDLLSSCGFALLGTPYVKKLRGDLFELRIMGRRGYRIILFHWNGDGFVLLHAFAKQTKKTPLRAIAVAEQRMNDWVDRMSASSLPSQRGL